MALGKQAKILSETQQKVVLSFLADRRFDQRNKVMFLLSVDAGLRAKEIAALEWEMVTDAQGALTNEIILQDKASKGCSGGLIYISRRLMDALEEYASRQCLKGSAIKSQSGRVSGCIEREFVFVMLHLERNAGHLLKIHNFLLIKTLTFWCLMPGGITG
jgi:integrase/recombinase XerD